METASVACSATSGSASSAAGPAARRIWIFSDPQVGLCNSNDGKTGGQWLQQAVLDLTSNMGGADYVLGLGDVVDNSADAEMQEYLDIRAGSGIKTWFEINGNHDYIASTMPLWHKHLLRPGRYVIEDGNCAFIMFSAEQSYAAGCVGQATFNWVKETITRYQGSNIVVCSHVPVYDTVAGSTKTHRHLYVGQVGVALDSEEKIAASKVAAAPFVELLASVRVDLWLSGHLHSTKRTPTHVFRRNGTTFVNVATTGHAYGTQMSVSYLLELTEGSRTFVARCRRHDDGVYLPDYEVKQDFPHPVALSPDGPRLIIETAIQSAAESTG